MLCLCRSRRQRDLVRAADADVKSGVEIFHLDVKLGPYLLTTDATLGRTTARRDVRFEIR